MIRLSPSAISDLTEIRFHTLHHWGAEQSVKYLDFLFDEMNAFLSGERTIRTLDELSDVHYIFAKWKNAKHGHYIVFKYLNDEMYILRVIHSAMDFRAEIEN